MADELVRHHVSGGYGAQPDDTAAGGVQPSDALPRRSHTLSTAAAGGGAPGTARDAKDTALGKALSVAHRSLYVMDAYTRHQQLVADYIMYYGGDKRRTQDTAVKQTVSDWDVLQQEHRFLWDDEVQAKAASSDPSTAYGVCVCWEPPHTGAIRWKLRLAKQYYDRLFKEYAIADLTGHKEGRVGLRWRTEQEVVSGKGQFVCGNKHCAASVDLQSYELNFGYLEAGQKKNALVKVRVCGDCAVKLFYQKVKALRKELKRSVKRGTRERERDNLPSGHELVRLLQSPTAGQIKRKRDEEPTDDSKSEDSAPAPAPAPATPTPTDANNPWAAPAASESTKAAYDEFLSNLFL